MNVKQLYGYLDKALPRSLSCDWDNDGLMCCPDPEREVKRILIALDATSDVCNEAINGGYDVIVTHHPLIFKPINSVVQNGGLGTKLIRLIKEGVSVMSFHTRLDAAPEGVNDALIGAVGICGEIETLEDGEGRALGRIGYTDEISELEDFAEQVKSRLSAPCVLTASGGKKVSRVAVVSGEGGSLISAALKAGADTLVSGRIGYHNMLIADEIGLNLIEAGHFYTEDPVCDRLSEIIGMADGDIETVYMKSTPIKMI